METIELKLNLHKLIEKIENERLLNAIYVMITHKSVPSGYLEWDSLPEDLKKEIEEGLEQADKGEVSGHDVVMKKYEKWL